MPFNIGLLSDAALTGLTDTEKESMQKQATQQFFLGSLLSGDPGIGFKSASEIPSTALNMQKMIRDSQIAQRQQEELAAFTGKFAPTPQQARTKVLNSYFGREPDLSSPYSLLNKLGAPQERVEPQLINKPIDYKQALTESLRLAGNPAQPQLRETLTAMQDKLQDGYIVGPGGVITGFAPKVDTKAGTVTTGTMVNGQPQFETNVLKGAAKAAALNTIPELQKGEQYAFDNNQNIIGIVNANGVLEALAARTRVETATREANIPRPSFTESGAPTFTYANPPGLTSGAVQPAGVAQPTSAQPVTGPSTAQTILNEAYKPILADAYKGYQTANKTAPYIDQLENAYNQKDFDTGSFTGLKTQLGNVFNSLGVSGERNKAFLKNAISARQAINALTGESLTEAVGAISNFEINYYGQRNAQITDPKESTKFNLAILREVSKRKQDYYKFVSDKNNAGPDAANKWAASPQGQKQMFEAASLRKYLPTKKVIGGPDDGKIAYILPNGDATTFD